MSENVEQVRNDRLLDLYNRRAYQEDQRYERDEIEADREPPPEEGKGRYVDTYA
jgi:hypothetical protein